MQPITMKQLANKHTYADDKIRNQLKKKVDAKRKIEIMEDQIKLKRELEGI